MLTTLASADAVTWLSILVKALAYGTTLWAIGSVLVLTLLRELSQPGLAALRRTVVLSALAAALFTLLRLPLRASFLMGGTWGGATDPALLGMVADSPLGTSVALRLVGLTLLLFVLWRARAGQALALLGAFVAATSFALRGHALNDPQLILGALITLHILCLSFWVGAFAPLARAARLQPPEEAGMLAHAFGNRALWAVALLAIAGGAMLWLLGAALPASLSTAYGQMVAVKLALFVGVMGFAALNKLSLTPRLLAGERRAPEHLRLSLRLEAALLGAILAVTATFTTLTSPEEPTRQAALAPQAAHTT